LKQVPTAYLVALFCGLAGYLIASGLYLSFDVAAWVQSTHQVLYHLPYAFQFLCSPARAFGIPCSLSLDGTVVVAWYDAEDMAISLALFGILLLFVPSFIVASRLRRGKGEMYRQASLVSLFLVSTAVTLYLIIAPWIILVPVQGAYTVAAGFIAGASLFLLRTLSYRTKHSNSGSAALAFLDVLAYLGVIGLAMWTFVFPIVHPFPADMMVYLFYIPSLPIGAYSLVFIWAMLVAIRIVLLPFTRPVSERLYDDVEDSLRRLAEAVSQVDRKLEGADGAKDPVLSEKVTSVLSELSAVRRELSSLRGSEAVGQGRLPAVSSVRMVEQPRAVKVLPKEPLKVIHPSTEPRSQGGAAVPDSVVDNPWLSVLSRRSAAAQERKQGASVSVRPAES